MKRDTEALLVVPLMMLMIVIAVFIMWLVGPAQVHGAGVTIHWDKDHPRPRSRRIDPKTFEPAEWHRIRVAQGILPDPETLRNMSYSRGSGPWTGAELKAATPGYAPLPTSTLRHMGDLGKAVQRQQTYRAISYSRMRARVRKGNR